LEISEIFLKVILSENNGNIHYLKEETFFRSISIFYQSLKNFLVFPK
jgi:hypothetical protein